MAKSGYVFICQECFNEHVEESCIGGVEAECVVCGQVKPRVELRHVLYKHLPPELAERLERKSIDVTEVGVLLLVGEACGWEPERTADITQMPIEVVREYNAGGNAKKRWSFPKGRLTPREIVDVLKKFSFSWA